MTSPCPIVEATGIVSSERSDTGTADTRAVESGDQITPVQLPVVSRAAAQLARSACDARLTEYLQTYFDTNVADNFNVRVFDDDVCADTFIDPAVLEISLGSRMSDLESCTAHLQIALDLHAYPALAIIASSPGASSLNVDRVLRHATAVVLLEPLLQFISQAGQYDPRVIDLQRGRLATTPSVALSFVINGRRHNALFSVDLLAADRFATVLRERETAGRDADSTNFPLNVPASLIVGVKALSVDVLQSLEAGDVLLRALFYGWEPALLGPDIDRMNSATAASFNRPRAIAAWGWLGLIRLYAAIELDKNNPVVIKEVNMSEELDPVLVRDSLSIDQPDNPIQIGELELPVQFEIDTVALPLAQLSALGPGYVVELPVALADARLRMVAHGQTIGYGELVAVGEHLGIRIIRMAHKHGSI